VSLKALGLRVQLGHSTGERCPNPAPAFGDAFVVLDDHGIHNVGLDFCNCELAEVATTQLLRFRWFPATVVNPKTAVTFRLLERFHLQSFEGKTSPFEFYNTLAWETDNTGIRRPKVCCECCCHFILERVILTADLSLGSLSLIHQGYAKMETP
jgi:hypothetical protein